MVVGGLLYSLLLTHACLVEEDECKTKDHASMLQVSAKASQFGDTSGERTQRDVSSSVGVLQAKLGSKDSMCQVMLPLWRAARKDIKDSSDNTGCNGLAAFYGFEPRPEDVKPTHSSASPAALDLQRQVKQYFPLHFVAVYKCANTEISCNLQRMLSGLLTKQLMNPSVEELLEKGLDPLSMSTALSFTFVRDPMARLLSGYSEVESWLQLGEPKIYHELHPKKPSGQVLQKAITSCHARNCSFVSEAVNSSARARAFLRDLLNLRLSGAWLWKHVSSMLAPVTSYISKTSRPLDMIGRLESFDADWARLQNLLNVEFPPFKRDCHAHSYSNSQGSFSARNFLSGVIANVEGGYTRALHCAVLLPEYVCFDYFNPVAAEDCVSGGYASSLQAWNVIVKNVVQQFCPSGVYKNYNPMHSY